MGNSLQPLPSTDGPIISALEEAELLALVATVAHLTGDLSLLDQRLVPDLLKLREPQSGYSEKQQDLARELILNGLRRFRDQQKQVPARPSVTDLHAIMQFIAGEPVTDRYVPLLLEELALDGDELRAPQWNTAVIAPERKMSALIIGAGMSGIAAAHRLRQAGVSVSIIEKNNDVGGTWLENRYPGCRVDIQNHMYSYSFAQRHDWPFFFSPRAVLHDYFRTCAEDFGLLPLIRFETEVESATWDEEAQQWVVMSRRPDGSQHEDRAEILVSAVGQLNRPLYPEITGRETFTGQSFHSAEWDDCVSLRGKKVAVIGTGASACQFIPAVAKEAGELAVFQRTPPWMIPAPRYHESVPAGFNWMLSHVPFYAEWYRFSMFWRGAEGMLPAATVDPEFPPTEWSVSLMNEVMRQMLTEWTNALTEGDENLRRQLTPSYPPLSKRFVVDDGSFALTLRQPHVSLVTEPISAIESKGIRTADGKLFEADVIIYGTGFKASQFLTPMTVTGRYGVDLHRQWAGDARAYLGVVIPNFPNFFCLYGPNTNIVANGSIIYFSECEVHYLVECVKMLLEGDYSSLDPRPEVHDAYNVKIDAANKLRTWGYSSVNSWYKNEYGRTAQNWPFSVLEFWEQTREPKPNDYILTSTSRKAAV